MEQSVVVTGAAGYVGKHVVAAVADLGFEPVAVIRRQASVDLDERARVVVADVLDDSFDLEEHVDVSRVAAVIHLAWQDGFVHNAPSHMTQLSRHFAFLTSLADRGIARVAALGTMHEIGYWEGAVTASTPTDPLTLYGVAKDALRRSTTIALSGRLEFLWLRAYYILGDDRRNRSIFAKILEAADRGETAFPFTTGKTLYDFIDVAELGRQIAVAATSSGLVGVINVSSGVPESLASKVERFIAENALEISLQYGAFPDRPYDSPGTWGDAEQITALMRTSLFAKEEL